MEELRAAPVPRVIAADESTAAEALGEIAWCASSQMVRVKGKIEVSPRPARNRKNEVRGSGEDRRDQRQCQDSELAVSTHPA